MKKVLLVLILALISIPVYALENHVYDYALSLNEDEKNALNEKIESLEYKDIILITIRKTNYNYDEYINKFLSSKNINVNKLVIVYSSLNNEYYIKNNGSNKYFTDKNINNFIKHIDKNSNTYDVFNEFIGYDKKHKYFSLGEVLVYLGVSILLSILTLTIFIKINYRVVKRDKNYKLKIKDLDEKLKHQNQY